MSLRAGRTRWAFKNVNIPGRVRQREQYGDSHQGGRHPSHICQTVRDVPIAEQDAMQGASAGLQLDTA